MGDGECRCGLHSMCGHIAFGGMTCSVVTVCLRLTLWPKMLHFLGFLGICRLSVRFGGGIEGLCWEALKVWQKPCGVVGLCLELLRGRRAGPFRLAAVVDVHDASRRVGGCVRCSLLIRGRLPRVGPQHPSFSVAIDPRLTFARRGIRLASCIQLFGRYFVLCASVLAEV